MSRKNTWFASSLAPIAIALFTKDVSTSQRILLKTYGPTNPVPIRANFAEWVCADCKVCKQCHDAGNEDKLLICDDCGKRVLLIEETMPTTRFACLHRLPVHHQETGVVTSASNATAVAVPSPAPAFVPSGRRTTPCAKTVGASINRPGSVPSASAFTSIVLFFLFLLLVSYERLSSFAVAV